MCELPRWLRMAFRGMPDPDLQLLEKVATCDATHAIDDVDSRRVDGILEPRDREPVRNILRVAKVADATDAAVQPVQ